MSDAFLRKDPDGKDWEIECWKKVPGKESQTIPALQTFTFMEVATGQIERFASSLGSCCPAPGILQARVPLGRLPARTVTPCSSHNNGTVIEWVWNKQSSEFSQCVNREQDSGEKNYLSFFIIQGITHPLQRTRSGQLWGCKALGPKPAGTSEGVFPGSAELMVSTL